ncbi:MAG: hypothetical protein RLZZ618_89 [Pseudomonadota bacterium]|jgi:C-terminal processing protease CtpA/Prc
MRHSFRQSLAPLALAALTLLASCGGDGDNGPIETGALSCTPSGEKAWLRDYMDDWYLWTGRSPRPDPAGYTNVEDYFYALRFAGDSQQTTPDRWSYVEDRASFDQFFTDGRTTGFGVSVNGVELQLPLRLRYIDGGSPAAAAGLVRGDTVVSVNGRTAADLVASNDFSALSASRNGQTLTLVVNSGGVTKTVVLTSATYDLTPVNSTAVFTLPNGRKAGYLVMKEFVSQAQTPLANAFASFRSQGATELILDLRYNGGGLVSVSSELASLVTGSARGGQVFTQLVYNSRHQGSNATYRLSTRNGAPFTRVVVLTGSRTCSASEMLVNGLKPYVDVVTIGGTTCGKPVGFSPRDSCDKVFNAVNFEAFNGANQGRYYTGIAPTCAVSDDFQRSLGDASEKLTAAALSYLQAGVCPVQPAAAAGLLAVPSNGPRRSTEPGDRQGMWAD